MVGYRMWRLPVVSTEGRRPERRDLLSTISRLSWREGLSAPRFALRSRRRRGWIASGAKGRDGEGRDGKIEISSLAVGEVPGRRQAGEGQGPFDEPMPVERSSIGQHVDLAAEPPRRQRRGGVGIAQDVDEIEGALA